MADPRAGERAALGSRCRELLQSDTFQKAIAALDAEFREAMFKTRPDESDKRESMFREYHALRQIVGRLQSWEADGVMAQMEIESDK